MSKDLRRGQRPNRMAGTGRTGGATRRRPRQATASVASGELRLDVKAAEADGARARRRRRPASSATEPPPTPEPRPDWPETCATSGTRRRKRGPPRGRPPDRGSTPHAGWRQSGTRQRHRRLRRGPRPAASRRAVVPDKPPTRAPAREQTCVETPADRNGACGFVNRTKNDTVQAASTGSPKRDRRGRWSDRAARDSARPERPPVGENKQGGRSAS